MKILSVNPDKFTSHYSVVAENKGKLVFLKRIQKYHWAERTKNIGTGWTCLTDAAEVRKLEKLYAEVGGFK